MQIKNEDVTPVQWQRKYRKPADLEYLWRGRSRVDNAATAKKMGFLDVCDCPERDTWGITNVQRRKNSGDLGQLECVECEGLLHPWGSIYECDECCELALSNTYPLAIATPFYCDYCN